MATTLTPATMAAVAVENKDSTNQADVTIVEKLVFRHPVRYEDLIWVAQRHHPIERDWFSYSGKDVQDAQDVK